MEPGNQLLDCRDRAHSQHFHATIFKIARMPAQIKQPGLIASATPEIHPLHTTADEAAARNYRLAQGIGRFAAWAAWSAALAMRRASLASSLAWRNWRCCMLASARIR